MRISILLGLGMMVAACGSDGDGRTPEADDRDTGRTQPEMRAATEAAGEPAEATEPTAEGVVHVVGNEPSPQVVLSVDEDGTARQIALVGELRNEIGRLSGVELWVAGDTVRNPQGIPERAIDVREYDVISVNSVPAYLGVLELRDGELWLERGEALKLAAIPQQLEGMAGAKVWVVGPVEGDEVRVQSFGIVRER